MAAGIDTPASTAAKRPAVVVRTQRAEAAPNPTAAFPASHRAPPPRVSGGQLLRVGILVAAALLLRAPIKFDPAPAGAPQTSENLRAR